MREKLKKPASLLLILCLVFSVIGGSSYATTRYFEDVKGHWAEDAIHKLIEQGIITGYPDGLLHPDEIITRGEFSTLLARTLDENIASSNQTNIFKNIKGHWAEKNILYLVSENIVEEEDYKKKHFEPNDPITRLEMVKMLVRALGTECHSSDCTYNLDFTDISSLKKEDKLYLCIGEKYSIIKGYADKTVKPNDNATRGEAFEMIVKQQEAKDKIEEQKPISKPSRPSGGGGSSYTPAPQFSFTIPQSSYVGEDIKISPTSKHVSSVVWSVTRDNLLTELSTVFEGKLGNNGGTLKAKQVGKYIITATVKNSCGREVTYNQTITVYPVVTANFTLPETAHTDSSIAVDLKTENLGQKNVVWTLTKGEESMDLETAITGKLQNTGGTIQFKEQGSYTLTATITDEIEKKTTVSHSIIVYPVVQMKLKLPTMTHTDKAVTLTLNSLNTEGLTPALVLRKDNTEVELDKYIEGDMSLNGGSIRFTEKGVYQLFVSLTDKTNRTFISSSNITVYPVGAVGFYLPSILHTDDTVVVETELDEIGDKTAIWTITKEGKEVAFSNCISETLTNEGGNIQFKEQGEYILKCAFTDEGGRDYSYEQTVKVYPVPTVTYTQPKFVHTDTEVEIETTATYLDGLTLEWLVDNSFGYQDWNTFVEGNLDNNGGTIHFKRVGIYELVCRITDETGRVFLFEPKNKTEVLPVLNLGFTMPKIAYTDTVIDLRTSGHNNTLPMEWTVSKDGTAVPLSSVIDGKLNKLGGKVTFNTHGEYVLTASMTDLLGRSYTHSESITIMPIVEFAFTIPKEVHYGDGFKVKISKSAHTDTATAVWTLTKNGETTSYTGELSKNGGTIAISDTGEFTLTAVVIDTLGRECRYTQEITITNTAPMLDNVKITPTRRVKNGKFLVNISAQASDADNDATTLEWENKSADNYYAARTHTVRVRAKDITGAYSDWASKTFTINNAAPTRPVITRTPNSNSITPGTAVTITAKSSDADGDALTYVWENRPNKSHVYPLGKNVVRVKAVDSTGAESPWAAIVFFVMDSNGSGGMLLTGPDSTILENGIEGATITKYTFTVPPVSGHSGNDHGRVRGYNLLTKQWDQLDYESTSNGITFTKTINSGLYSKLEFYYYTNHDCMYKKSNITYTVEYFFE